MEPRLVALLPVMILFIFIVTLTLASHASPFSTALYVRAIAYTIQDKKATAGPDWYGLPKTVQTPELARDLKLLANRNVLDTHRHYKKESPKSAFPQFSQIGTVVEGATEFFSARIARRERKQTLAEDLLAGEKSSGKFNSKFQQLQAKKASGRDRHKHMKSKFKSKR